MCELGNRYLLFAKCEVRTASYGPGIDQSQHAKSVSHIIIRVTLLNKLINEW